MQVSSVHTLQRAALLDTVTSDYHTFCGMMHIWYGASSVGHRTSSLEDSTSTDAASSRVVPIPKQSMCSGLRTNHIQLEL